MKSIDDLCSWLVLLGQDPKVLSSSVHISITTALGHALQLYTNFDGVSTWNNFVLSFLQL